MPFQTRPPNAFDALIYPPRTCHQCNTDITHAAQVYTDGQYVCVDCADSYYWRCSGCDELIPNGENCEACDDAEGSGCDCGLCRSNRDDDYDDEPEGINNYSYKPRPEFHGDGTQLFLGPEIEIATPRGKINTAAELANRYLGRLGYLKEDTSIGTGFEIVTHPMTYTYAMEHFPWEMLTKLADMGCRAAASCGMHVHLSRAGFDSPAHVFRWMKFIYRNADKVEGVARRQSRQWARFDGDARINIKNYAKNYQRAAYADRYCAINVTNDATLEMRVFASSLNPTEIKAALGLAEASAEYTRTLTANKILKQRGWEWDTFVAWLVTQPQYAPLSTEIERLAPACVS